MYTFVSLSAIILHSNELTTTKDVRTRFTFIRWLLKNYKFFFFDNYYFFHYSFFYIYLKKYNSARPRDVVNFVRKIIKVIDLGYEWPTLRTILIMILTINFVIFFYYYYYYYYYFCCCCVVVNYYYCYSFSFVCSFVYNRQCSFEW